MFMVSRGHCLEVAINVHGKSWTLSGGSYRCSCCHGHYLEVAINIHVTA